MPGQGTASAKTPSEKENVALEHRWLSIVWEGKALYDGAGR